MKRQDGLQAYKDTKLCKHVIVKNMKRMINSLLSLALLLSLCIVANPNDAFAVSKQRNSEKIVGRDHQKYTYNEMKADIRLLAKRYPGKVSYSVIGKSEDGRNIYNVVLGNPNAKKSMIVVAAIHGVEYMTSLVCMNQIEYYLQNYWARIDGKRVKDTLGNIAIHYIPMANPDGVTLSQFGVKRIRNVLLRMKLRKITKNTRYWKANAKGVNLNGNFPILFKKKGKPSGVGYTGPRACSESESQAINGLVKQLKENTKLKGIVNYHAMGEILFGGCSASKSCKKVTSKMYKVARRTTGYRNADGVYKAITNGSFRAYVMHKLDVPSITIEIGRIRCPGPIYEFPSIWNRNKKVVLREARLFA